MGLGITKSTPAAEVGTVDSFAQPIAPTGWLACNGATVSRTAYAALFAKIGTIYGAGDGSTTFGLPDLRGEFVRGWDNGRGVDPRSIGTAQAGQMPSHTHGISSTDGTSAATAGVAYYGPGATVQTGAAGGTSNGSENRPRNVAMLYCIKF